MEKLNKKNGEKVSVQSKNQRGIFYRLKDRLKLNKKNRKKVIVQAEDQPSLAYELTNKYKLEKNKSDDMKALVALEKDLSKYDPATIEGILFYLPLTPEKKNLFQPRNRIVRPEDQQSHAYRLTNKYELKMERTNPEKFAKLGRELSRYDPATIEGILLHLPLIPEEKDLLQPRNRIVQPEDQLELADRLIDKYKLKNKHTNLKTMAALGKDLSRYDPDSTEGILLHLPLIPEEKKQLQPRNRIVKPEDRLELADRLTDKYNLKMERTDPVTFAKLDRELFKYDSDSTAGILLHLPLIPEEKKLLQPSNRIVKPENQPNLAYRLTKKYKLKNQHTNVKTLVALGKELSKYDPNSTAGILLLLPLNPEEKKLLQPRNRIAQPKDQPALAYELTEEKKQSTNVETLVALDKDLSKDDPTSSGGNISNLPLNPEEKKLLQPRNRIAQPDDQPALAYELTEEKKQSTNMETLAALDKDLSKDDPTSSGGNISNRPLNPEEKNLLQQRTIEMESIDRTFFIDYLNEQHNLNSNTPLSEKTKAALIEDLDKFYYLPLKPSTCYNFISDLHIINRDDVYELLNDQIPKVNELITQVINNATLAITNKYQLLENQSVPKEKLETIATEILDLNLGEEQEREVIAKLEISKEDRAALEEIYREKRDLLQTQESQKDAEIKAATIAITNTYELSVEKTTPQEKLKAIANELINRNLSTLQEHEIIYLLEIETKDRDTLRTIYKELKKIQESQKDANVKAVTIAFTNIYKLSEDQPNSQNNLKAIAKTIVDLDLSDEQKREVILELEIPKKDKDTLRKIYKELLEKTLQKLHWERASLATAQGHLFVNGKLISKGGSFKDGAISYYVKPDLIKADDQVTMNFYDGSGNLLAENQTVSVN
ncbi:immunoglobulin-like domain-containing protein [Enterococcus hirae]|uniref:immunoglobulin-like domain-containing protein n=1 Tax=Enterococcus hirae TaxID=1354 RepID=UPI0030D443C3